MSFNIADIAGHIQSSSDEILVRTNIKLSPVLDKFAKRDGLWGTIHVKLAEISGQLKDTSSCGFSSNGTVKLSKATLTGKELGIHHSLCSKDLNDTWLAEYKAAGDNLTVPFESWFTEKVAEQAQEQFALCAWVGDADASGDTSIAQQDGVITILKEKAGVKTFTYSAPSSSNIEATINSAIDKLEEAGIVGHADVFLATSPLIFNTFLRKITADNKFHYTSDQAFKDGFIVIPGTDITLYKVNEMKGYNYIVGGRFSNFVRGFNTDKAVVASGYDAKQDELWIKIENIQGYTVGFGSECVLGSVA